MLRTAGCNLVLALAGAPVRAESLRVAPLQLAASIRISDSLQTGTSHFYAEIKRLRQVVELTEGERRGHLHFALLVGMAADRAERRTRGALAILGPGARHESRECGGGVGPHEPVPRRGLQALLGGIEVVEQPVELRLARRDVVAGRGALSPRLDLLSADRQGSHAERRQRSDLDVAP